jgi:uncharacterized protein with PQ loop repeat
MVDFLIMLFGLMLSISFIPQVLRCWKFKSASQFSIITVILTFICLYIQASLFLYIGLFLTAINMYLIGTLWFLIFVIKVKENKK